MSPRDGCRIDEQIIASAGLFAWASHDKVVIVDIDGTVTRTDAGGVWPPNPVTCRVGRL